MAKFIKAILEETNEEMYINLDQVSSIRIKGDKYILLLLGNRMIVNGDNKDVAALIK